MVLDTFLLNTQQYKVALDNGHQLHFTSWNMKLTIIPIVISAFVTITKGLSKGTKGPIKGTIKGTAWNDSQRLGKGIGNRRTCQEYTNYSIVEINQNT